MTKKYPTVTIRIDQETLDKIDYYAEWGGLTRSEYIKGAIMIELENDAEEWQIMNA